MVAGYKEVNPLSGGQSNYLNQLLSQISGFLPQAAEGYQQFLPGGGGGQPIIDKAMQRYKQQTIPDILNTFGSEAGRGSSSLNQALASSASNLNTDLASQLAQMQMQAAGGLGQLGLGGGQLGLGTQAKALVPKEQSFLQQLLLGLIGGGSKIGSSMLSNPSFF